MDFGQLPGAGFGHDRPEQWEEDAIAYIYSEKMRRDDGEEIDDDDLVDAVFGEDRPARHPVSAPTSRPAYSAGGNSCAALLVTALLLALVAFMCWGMLMPH